MQFAAPPWERLLSLFHLLIIGLLKSGCIWFKGEVKKKKDVHHGLDIILVLTHREHKKHLGYHVDSNISILKSCPIFAWNHCSSMLIFQ